MYHLYIIQNRKNNYYVGTTKNISDRLKRHNENRSKSTKYKGPWELVYKENFLSRSEAMKREYYIKRQKSKRFLQKLIKNQGKR